MKPFAQLEALIAEVIERPAWLLSTRRLHPLELTSALIRALEARALRLADRVLAPDAFTVRLNPDDFAAYGDAVPSLERELGEYLARTVAERDLSCNRPPEVTLAADPVVRSGKVRVEAAFSPTAERPSAPAATRAAFPSPVWHAPAPTAAAPAAGSVDALPARPRDGVPALLAVGLDGRAVRTYTLNRLPATIGRRDGCEVCLVDTKVSREHARIDRDRNGFAVTDLGSLNGTFLNGRSVQGSAPLVEGDELQIGRLRLRFVTGSARDPRDRPGAVYMP